MNETSDKPVVEYWSDLLCVWAWIGQPRLEEVADRWGDRITLRPRCVDVFGDAHGKIRRQWGEEDGFERFAHHVQSSAEGHPHTQLHSGLWDTVRPTGSLPAHLHLKAAELAASAEQSADYARALRGAFFVEGRDISRATELVRIARGLGLDVTALQDTMDNGKAQAALAADFKRSQAERIAGSPTWAMNSGRQLLYGNVGYRIIEANLEEYLRDDRPGASWC